MGMPTLRFGVSLPDQRSWDVADEVTGDHLLAQLLHGNLGSNLQSCELVLATARRSAEDKNFEEDLGFFNSVGVSFKGGVAHLDHVVSDYGTFELPAAKLVLIVKKWIDVVSGRSVVEKRIEID